MKISIRKSNLLQGINIVSKAVSNKTTHPILSCILVEAAGGVIKLTANDMEIGIESYVDGTVIEDGKVALEAKLFSDFIRKLPDSDITIESDKDSKTLIKCERLEFNIPGKSGEDFSNLPVVSKDKFITISQFALREVINQTIFSISDNENNKLMTGELFEVSNNKLSVVSLDGHRISIRYIELKGDNSDIKVVLGVIATILITMAIVLFACWPPFHRFLRWLLEKADALFKGRFAKQIDSLSGQTAMMEDATRVVLKKPWLIVVVMLLDICKFACWFAIPYIVCHNLCDMNIVTSIGITAMSVMLAAVIPMPGGIGSSELVMTAIYSGLVGSAAAGAMALLYRFATFMFPFIIGAFTAIFFKRFKRYKAAQNEKQGIPDGDSMADTDS